MMVPSLVLRAYDFLDTSIAIIRPTAMSDIHAVRLFRKYARVDAEHLSHEEVVLILALEYPDPAHWRFLDEAAEMLRMGWKRTSENWDKKRAAIMASNEKALAEAIHR